MSKEKQCKCCHEWWYASVIKEDLCPNCYDYFKQLKQQLEEYKNEGNTSTVNSWDEMLKNCKNCGLNECIGCEYTQTCVQNIKQQLAEKDKEIAHLKEKDNYHLRYELAGADEIIANLRQQLAEKQNTIDEINKEFVQAVHDWKTLCAEKDKDISKLQASCQQIKTQLAIQELEKVKKRLLEESKRYPIVYDITDDLVGGAIDKDKTFEIIDNQINELKKG